MFRLGSLGLRQAADHVISVEHFFGKIQRPVIIMIGGFEAYRRITPRDAVETSGQFHLISGNLRHAGAGLLILGSRLQLLSKQVKLNLVGYASKMQKAGFSYPEISFGILYP